MRNSAIAPAQHNPWRGHVVTVGALLTICGALWASYTAYATVTSRAAAARKTAIEAHNNDDRSHNGLRKRIESRAKRLEKKIDRLHLELRAYMRVMHKMAIEQAKWRRKWDI